MANPTFPPAVLEALRRGNKIEAIKLLRQASNLGLAEVKTLVDTLEANKPAKAQARPAGPVSIKPHHHIPAHYVPHAKSGLSPGQVPNSGGQFGWVFLLLIGVVVAFLML